MGDLRVESTSYRVSPGIYNRSIVRQILADYKTGFDKHSQIA